MAAGLVNIGVCALAHETSRRLRQAAEEYAAQSEAAQHGPWRGGGEALWSGTGDTWHHAAGMVSCGDAAGLIDPLSGEGIAQALESGERAGLAISQYLAEGRNPARLAEYSQWVSARFSDEYRDTPMRHVVATLFGI